MRWRNVVNPSSLIDLSRITVDGRRACPADGHCISESTVPTPAWITASNVTQRDGLSEMAAALIVSCSVVLVSLFVLFAGYVLLD
jgi:hypothetical protein